MADIGKKYVVLHDTVSWQAPQKDREGKVVTYDKGDGNTAPVMALCTFRRGDVVEGGVLSAVDLDRLQDIGAVRPANEEEAGLPKVTLPLGETYARPAESVIAEKEQEVERLRLKLQAAQAELSSQRVQAMPDPALVSAESRRLQDENRRLQAELAQARGHKAEAPAPPEQPPPEPWPEAGASPEEADDGGGRKRGRR